MTKLLIARTNLVHLAKELTEKFIQAFHEDMEALGCLRPDLEPRATQHVGDIIDLITRLIEKNHAYAVDGDVYFSVNSLSKYGSLSGRNQEDNRAGERVVVDSRKKNQQTLLCGKQQSRMNLLGSLLGVTDVQDGTLSALL